MQVRHHLRNFSQNILDSIQSLFRSFSPITLPTQHLAVLDDGATAIAPRGNMVALHELEVECLAAERTDVVLTFPCSQLDVLWESTKVQIVFIPCQHVGDDARLPLNLAVAH